MNAYLTIVVPATNASEYRNNAAAWQAGAGMFVAPLTSNSTDITHYISSGAMDADVAVLFDDPPGFANAVNSKGGNLTTEKAQSLRDAMDIVYLPESGHPDAETVAETLARLGLVRYQEEIQ